MKKSNKGYTLAELLITIAIFSIVMVGVCSIMTNSMKAYNVSNYDVSVQENSQIVANQLEELLSEADSIGTSGGNYTFSSKGASYELSYNSGNKELSLAKDGGAFELIAEDVSAFNLDGWNAGGDNKFVINMTMDNTKDGKIQEGTAYTVERQVYSRNNPEDSDFYDIKYLKSEAGTGPDPTSGAIAKVVKRYEPLNLSSECQIRYEGGLYTYTSDPMDPTDRTATDLYYEVEVYDDGFSNTTTGYADSKSILIKTKTGVNGTFTNGAPGNFCYVGYKSWDATNDVGVDEVVVTLTVEDVSMVDDNLVYQHQMSQSTNNGIHIPIEFKGININEAIKAGKTVTYTYDFQVGGSSVQGGAISAQTMSANTSANISGGDVQANNSYGRLKLGIFPEPYNGGVFVSTSNDTINTMGSSQKNIENGELLVTITVDGTPYSTSMKFDVLGSGF